ncbi:glycosyl hydrolase family 18 protein [Pendulispora albinea]|uniref:Glycosyl hydrolase family 18 protein n=1 Tax=Pendulispora albinea TaxID=2741071 RepID=A0ABZ2LSX1_9BACT
MRLFKALPAMVLAAATAAVVATGGVAETKAAGPVKTAAAIPSRVFAPYFEAWTGESPATLSQQSGAKFLTMAFLQTASRGSCTVLWNGDAGMPVSQSIFGNDFATIRSNGGDVIPAFGGYTAGNTGTEIADSCTDVSKIAAAIQSVITTYNITRIDFDIEDNSLTNTAGIDRRNKAVKQVEDWAAANGRTLQVTYTLPTTVNGLAETGLAVMRNAVSNNARIDIVNIMTFDYYDGNPNHQMAEDTKTAAAGLRNQLGQLYPGKTPAQLAAMIGVTEMIGIDDFGPGETFQKADANPVLNWANSFGISQISFWALQRDNGKCPGTGARNDCSGIDQPTWFFTQAFAPFTSGGTGNDFSIGVAPESGTVKPGESATATVSTSVTSGQAQTVNLQVSGAPQGVSATVSPSSVTAGGSATLTVSTSATTALGSYPITVTGAAPSGSRTAIYTLKVSNGPPPGKVVNGDFESGVLDPWRGQPGDAIVSTPTHGGSKALLVAATASQNGQAEQTVTLEPNKSYTLKAWVQGNFAFVGVSGGASASTWTSSSTWKQVSLPFTTGASNSVTVWVHGWFGQGNVFVDDVTIE